ncbi:uncharacterized protein LOC129739978 [Uranotaenia lowii]|uniref:uncharacterized protein LOC129739978 n=1 Tax=Uranotaenia lowii TaxID=190385 RepID=UPI002479D8A1|nr:uncharacterized protein LOC129739978 [Uranotaenia lowii]
MKLLVFAIVLGVVASVTAKPSPRQFSMEEFARLTEEFRERFDDLHEEKDRFVSLVRIIARGELNLLNRAVLENLGNAWSDIEHEFDDTRATIAERILDPNADEDCLLGLVSELVAEQVRAGSAMSSCAADKYDVKSTIADEMRALANILQRISTAAAEYTLYSYATHNSFTDAEDQLEWLEQNFQNQENFWNDVARPEAQEDVDNLELNRPILVEENRLCLERIIADMALVERNVNNRIQQCIGA